MMEKVNSMEKQLKNDLSEIECLKTQLQDKDAVIADLSRHLDDAPTPRASRRGKKSSVTDNKGDMLDELDNLRKEVSILHHQVASFLWCRL